MPDKEVFKVGDAVRVNLPGWDDVVAVFLTANTFIDSMEDIYSLHHPKAYQGFLQVNKIYIEKWRDIKEEVEERLDKIMKNEKK